jgi:signal transduction histidine kinase
VKESKAMAESGFNSPTDPPLLRGLRWLIYGRRADVRVRHSYPLLGILVLAVISAVALPLLNTLVIYPAYTEIMVGTFENTASRLAAHTIPPSIRNTALTPAVLDTPRFLADVYRLESSFGLIKVAVLSPEGCVLYSTNPGEIGAQTVDSAFERVALGNPQARLGTLRSLPTRRTAPIIDVVDAYVPLMQKGVFLGAFRIVFDVTGPKNELERFNTYATAATFIISFCLLCIVLILLRMEASREYARQQADALRLDVEHITRHDIKTPLLGALNGINYLENFTAVDAEQRDMLEEMRQSLNTGLDLINRSLDLYKMETGNYEYAPVVMDILPTCRRVADDLSGMAKVRGVDVIVSLDGAPLKTGDALEACMEGSLCYAVLANLVKNAIEASDTGDSVEVRIGSGEEVALAVHNRAAVPESVRDVFFQKYATAGKRTGTGLGTYSAKLMVQVMGGRIAMETSEEDGTTVTVTLPSGTDQNGRESCRS